MGQRNYVHPSQVTAMDWLRLLVREEAQNKKAIREAKDALEDVKIIPGETCLVAADRFIKAARATFARADMPYRAEATYVWNYVSVILVQEIFGRFGRMLAPVYYDREGLEAIVRGYSEQLARELRSYQVKPHRPNCFVMRKRGEITKAGFEKLVWTLAIDAFSRDMTVPTYQPPRPRIAAISPVYRSCPKTEGNARHEGKRTSKHQRRSSTQEVSRSRERSREAERNDKGRSDRRHRRDGRCSPAWESSRDRRRASRPSASQGEYLTSENWIPMLLFLPKERSQYIRRKRFPCSYQERREPVDLVILRMLGRTMQAAFDGVATDLYSGRRNGQFLGL